MSYNINVKVAPTEWLLFKKWHALACKGDPMTAKERWKALGRKTVKSS
jgi:hypothetical protein